MQRALCFMLLSLAWSSCLFEAAAQQKAGVWLSITPKARYDSLAVARDSILARMSDSLRVVRNQLAMMDRLRGDGLQDYLAVWVNDSTLTLWIPMDSLLTVMNRAEGRRDSTVFGAYDVEAHDWAFPGYIDEPPYPDWYSRDWTRLKKTGVYVNPTSPLQLVWHMDGDSVATFELKLPRARLLQFLGIDSVATSVGPRFIGAIYPDSGSNWATFQTLVLNDSTRSFQLAAGPGITFQPAWSSATKDSLTLFINIDYDVLWYRIRDSVLANAGGGGGGATTFTGLTDTPASYSGQGGKVVSVKTDESGLEFTVPSAGGGGGSDMIVVDTVGTWIDSVTYYTVGFMAPVVRLRQGRNALTDSLSWYRTGWYEYIFPVDFPYPLSTRLGKGHICYYLELVSDSANGVFFTGTGEFDALTYETNYGSLVNGVTRSEGVFSNTWGISSSYGYSTVQAQKKPTVTGSLDSLRWYDDGILDPATMTPRAYRHLLMVSGSGTTLNTFLGSMRIRIYFHQRQGYSSSWYIKPLSWRLYRQWK